ncbi:NLI interacting factor-like phosphatase-domain-containing protein [Collybia nuda]|uniref:NLI interacting factor-like phosphatase-domain-containing protein n=1 Tax=Collybia nuda TaxID=64659 RepID=A0A9P6CHS0_9AGAR|nr:NLI interacting factor-like phosphatase-domain-containing protein [Collybia nuda]
MNSLAYLSRQFDVLASARTPPSTPTTDRSPFISERRKGTSDRPLQRTSTWSTKSFLFPPLSTPPSLAPKRSSSSPAFASLQRLASTAPKTLPIPPVLESSARSKPQVESIIRRIFFIRVFILIWDNFRAAWTSLWRRGVTEDGQLTVVEGQKQLLESGTPGQEAGNINNLSTLPQASGASTPSLVSIITQDAPDTLDQSDLKSESRTKTSKARRTQPVIVAHSLESPSASVSRSSTPLLNTRKSPFPSPKTLVLDLDETLIHSTSRPLLSSTTGGSGLLGLGSFDTRNKGASHMVEVVLGGRSTLYHVYKRPFVDFFLRTVSGWYTLVIFTASMKEYADPVIDWLDGGRGILGHRLFRDSCTQLPNGSYTKDLTIVEADLSRVCLVDNSPVSYRANEANGIPIEGWTHDPSDEALLDLLPVLDSLRFTTDVRRVLGLRSAGVFS